MALILCPDCGKDVSDLAPACINCGRPIRVRESEEEHSCPDCRRYVSPKSTACIYCGRPLDTLREERPFTPAPRERKREEEGRPAAGPQEKQDELPMRWFRFYVFFYLPLQAVSPQILAGYEGLADIYEDAVAREIIMPVSYPQFTYATYIILGMNACLCLSVILGLYKRRNWAWVMNSVILFFGITLAPLGVISDFDVYAYCVMAGLILWVLPNYIYFKRRRFLFDGTAAGAQGARDPRQEAPGANDDSGTATSMKLSSRKSEWSTPAGFGITLLGVIVILAVLAWLGGRHDLSSPAGYATGMELYNEGRHEEAATYLLAAARTRPGDGDLFFKLGRSYLLTHKYQEAIEAYTKAIELEPLEAASHNNLGVAYQRLQRYQDALSAYETAVQLNPDDAFYHLNVGIVSLRLGNIDQAIRELESLRRLDPASARELQAEIDMSDYQKE